MWPFSLPWFFPKSDCDCVKWFFFLSFSSLGKRWHFQTWFLNYKTYATQLNRGQYANAKNITDFHDVEISYLRCWSIVYMIFTGCITLTCWPHWCKEQGHLAAPSVCVDLKANSGVCPLVILAFHVIHNGSESQGFLTLCVSAQTSNCHSAWQASSRGKCIMNDNMSASRGLRKSLQVYTHTWFSWVEKVLGKKATNILTQRVLWDFHSLS